MMGAYQVVACHVSDKILVEKWNLSSTKSPFRDVIIRGNITYLTARTFGAKSGSTNIPSLSGFFNFQLNKM